MPMPTKARVALTRIAQAMRTEICVKAPEMLLGSKCTNSMRVVPLPMARADSISKPPRKASISARTTRAKIGASSRPMTRITLVMDCPVAATMVSARMIEGNTRSKSMLRSSASSIQPPR